jgi:hypothetical protein
MWDKLNRTRQLLACVDDANLLGENLDVIKKKIGTLFATSNDVGPDVNAEETKHMLPSRRQNSVQNHAKSMTSL